MSMITCQRCGMSVVWDGASRVAVCGNCGARYLMHPRQRGAAGPDGIGRDDVAVIPIRTGSHAGRSYARSFIPKGWTASADDPEATMSVPTPLTMRVRYESNDGRATIARTGCLCYKHIDDVRENAPLQMTRDINTVTYLASYRDATGVCDMAAWKEGDVDCGVLAHEDDEDDVVKGLVNKMRADLKSASVSEWDYSYCRRTYRALLADGTQRLRTVEALVDYVAIPPSPAEVQMFAQAQAILARTNPFASLGGMFGMGGIPGMGGMPGIEGPKTTYYWETVFLLEIEATPDAFAEAREVADAIRSSYEESPEFERTRQQMSQQISGLVAQSQMQRSQAVNSAMSRMAQDNAAHWDRMNNIVQSTNDYTNNVMHDIMASNAASHERTANLQSEMIRDVNTYYANGGVVEASTSWDHVYQGTDRPDWFVATEGFDLRPGVDFEELPRTNGWY